MTAPDEKYRTPSNLRLRMAASVASTPPAIARNTVWPSARPISSSRHTAAPPAASQRPMVRNGTPSDSAATSAIRGSFLKPHSSTALGSYFGGALVGAVRTVKRRWPFSRPAAV